MEYLSGNRPQLYSLIFEHLKPRIDSVDDLGSMLGYSVLKGLVNFQPPLIKTKSRKMRIIKKIDAGLREKEIECVYSGIQGTIEELNQKGVLQSLSDLVEETDPWLKNALSDPDFMKQKSVLLKNMLNSIASHRNNYADVLRRKGLDLSERVRQKGAVRRGDAIMSDYAAVERSFVTTKMYAWYKLGE